MMSCQSATLDALELEVVGRQTSRLIASPCWCECGLSWVSFSFFLLLLGVLVVGLDPSRCWSLVCLGEGTVGASETIETSPVGSAVVADVALLRGIMKRGCCQGHFVKAVCNQ